MLVLLRGLLLVSLIPGSLASAPSPEVQFVNPGCRIAFTHPTDWKVVADTTGWEAVFDSTEVQDLCRLTVLPRERHEQLARSGDLDLYTISVRVIPKGVWDHVPSTGFRKRDSGWVVLGRHDLESPADTLSGPGWSGVRGVATLGCYGEDGQYQGLCSYPMALVGTRDRCVLFAGGPQSEDVLDRILASLRF